MTYYTNTPKKVNLNQPQKCFVKDGCQDVKYGTFNNNKGFIKLHKELEQDP